MSSSSPSSLLLTPQSIATPTVILISLSRTTLPLQNVTALSTSSQELCKSLTNIKPPELHFKVSPPITSLTSLYLYTSLLLDLFHSPSYRLPYKSPFPYYSNYNSSFTYGFISIASNYSTIYPSNYIKCLFITSYLSILASRASSIMLPMFQKLIHHKYIVTPTVILTSLSRTTLPLQNFTKYITEYPYYLKNSARVLRT